MSNYCRDCGKPLPIDSDSTFCWQHGGPPLRADSQIRCPYCREVILADARKCRFCGEFLVKVVTPSFSQEANFGAVTPARPIRNDAPKSKQVGTQSTLGNMAEWMGRHPIWTIVILMFFIAFLSTSLLKKDDTNINNSSSASQPNPGASPRGNAAKANNSDLPFDPSVKKLASGFAGDDIEAIYDKLTEIHSSDIKDEFETSQEFRERMDHVSSQPLMGSLTQKSTLAFVVPLDSTPYEADTRVLRMKLSVMDVIVKPFERNTREKSIVAKMAGSSTTEGVGENAFGAKRAIKVTGAAFYNRAFSNSELRDVRRREGYEEVLGASIPLDRDEASKIKDQVRGLVICKLVPPFASERQVSGQATIDNPTESHYTVRYVHISVLGIWFFDSGSGRILVKLVPR